MSEVKHTPGPWEANSLTNVWAKTSGVQVVRYAGGHTSEEAEANARLIAAAPELLEAAKLVIAWFEAEDDHSKVPDFYDRLEMCRASEKALRGSIAKATGGAS